jgi:hypothetical protein
MKRALAVAAALVMFGGVASAHTGFDYRLQLSTSEFSANEAEWQFGVNDSPLDANHARLRLSVPDEIGAAIAYPQRLGISEMPLADIRNLSFDFLKPGAGGFLAIDSPSITVSVDEDGDGVSDGQARLSAIFCRRSVGSGWARSDWTGRTDGGCSLVYFGSTGTSIHESGAGQSAWDDFAMHYPQARIPLLRPWPVGSLHQGAHLFQGPIGTSYVDRIAFHRHMYVRPGSQFIAHCPSEASC